MFDHVVRQLATILNRARTRGVTGEDARTAAAHLRTLTVYTRQIDLDGPAKKALRDLVRTQGRNATLFLEVDGRKAQEYLKQFGVDADARWFDTSAADYNTRAEVLDELDRIGVSGLFVRAAATFEAIATEADRRGGQLAGVRRVQYPYPNWNDGYCEQLQSEITRLSMDGAFVCAAAAFYAALAPVCGMIEAAIGVQMVAYFYYCGG